MALPLALPLAPVVAPGASAAAATFLIGSGAYLAQGWHQFRRTSPGLPPITGREHLPTLKEMVADAIAGAKVPIGNPLPPPWDPYRWIRPALTALAFQLWGLLNSKPKATIAPGGNESFTVTGLVGAGGGKVLIELTGKQRYHTCTNPKPGDCYGPEVDANSGVNYWKSYIAGGGAIAVATTPGNSCGINSVTVTVDGGPGNLYTPAASLTGGTGSWCGDVTRWSAKLTFYDPIGATSAPVLPTFPAPSYPDGWAPAPVPVTDPEDLAAPPTPQPLFPFTVPAPPETEPITQPEVEPAAIPPAVAPLPALRPAAVPLLPGAQPVVDGAVVAPAPLPVPTTDPNAVYPIPGRPPIVGNGPQPNLQEMAKELGRIEAKLHGLMNPQGELNPIPEWMNDLGDGLSKLLQLWELLTATQAGGQYTLSSECVVDAEGNRVESVAEYSGAFNWLQVLSNKMDALAELQQHAKDLKQPICRHKPVGQPVQITFVETQ